MVMFHSYVNVYQRVVTVKIHESDCDSEISGCFKYDQLITASVDINIYVLIGILSTCKVDINICYIQVYNIFLSINIQTFYINENYWK